MGTVFRAFDTKLQRDVALKILDSADDDLLGRFLREQEITACLDHPNFVRVLATGYISTEDGSLPFYTMPLIRGQNLERLILRRGLPGAEGERLRRDFSTSHLLRLFGQLCLTLQSAHETRIIHRDLKPSNILVGPYGDAYVTDLGLAKFLGVGEKETGRFERHVLEQFIRLQRLASISDGTLGTPYYMAPEQILAPWSVDPRADIFGLGGILYFILTGQRTQFVAPAMSKEGIQEQRVALERRLVESGHAFNGISELLRRPRSSLHREVLVCVQEYEDFLGIERKSEYHKFRMTMRACEILPPSRVLWERRASLAGKDVDLALSGPPDVDPAVEAICMKALSKSPEERFPSCHALWKELLPYAEASTKI
jgi:serine/threonine protein kinase